jgi:hypothetical protein
MQSENFDMHIQESKKCAKQNVFMVKESQKCTVGKIKLLNAYESLQFG